nr:MAG TPA: hypothetical protein [Caudoviricetes sp.]
MFLDELIRVITSLLLSINIRTYGIYFYIVKDVVLKF